MWEISCYFVLFEISEGVMCLFTCANFLIYLPVSVSWIFHHHLDIWLWQGKPFAFCDYYNHNLRQIIADNSKLCCLFCCVSRCLSFCLYVRKMCISHSNGVILAGAHNNTTLQLHSIYKWFCFGHGEIIIN